MRALRTTTAGLALAALAAAAACSSSTATPNAADRAFLQRMIPHHQRAIAVARIAETRASDLRVAAVAQRIVDEQTPELERMQRAAKSLHLDLTAGAATAMHRITDTQVARLTSQSGTAFDRDFVSLNITSEQGAYDMAEADLHRGAAAAVRDVAGGIAKSPGEIRELRVLLALLPAG